MAKDPAALFYIADWFLTTQHMKAHARGWFLNLILHQFDKTSLPNDTDELAVLSCVRPSEFNLFNDTWNETLKQLFNVRSDGRLENEAAKIIIQERGAYKEANNKNALVSVFSRFIREYKTKDENIITFCKKNVDVNEIVTGDKQSLERLYERLLNLYEGRGEVENEVIIKDFKKTETNDQNLILRFVEQFKENFDNDYLLDQTIVAESKYTPAQLAVARQEFWNSKELDSDMMGKPYNDLKLHFLRWNRLNRDRIKKETKINKTDGAGGPSSTATNWG